MPQTQTKYKPHGNHKTLWSCRDKELLLEGPAGTGKTRALLEKNYLQALKYPNTKILWVRDVKASLNTTVLPLFETSVAPHVPWTMGADPKSRTVYNIPNGSQIHCGGLDNAAHLMSSEFDVISCFEATDGVTLNDWEYLLTRLNRSEERRVGKEC